MAGLSKAAKNVASHALQRRGQSIRTLSSLHLNGGLSHSLPSPVARKGVASRGLFFNPPSPPTIANTRSFSTASTSKLLEGMSFDKKRGWLDRDLPVIDRPNFTNPGKKDGVLIAARGVCAQTIQHACESLGVKTFNLDIEGDTEKVKGKTTRVKTEGVGMKAVLDYEQLIKICKEKNIKVVHLGWGGLSENYEAHSAFRKAGIWVVGPEPSRIKLMADKITAKEVAIQAGFESTLNSKPTDSVADIVDWVKSENIEYPIIVKAKEGGGGKGIRIVTNEAELSEKFQEAQTEAYASFANNMMFAEQCIDQAKTRHKEIQAIGDVWGRGIELSQKRDCSMQDRGQKILEETSVTLDRLEQGLLTKSDLIESIKYAGLGTLEYLDKMFMEMNTRVQVEHKVTENHYGIKLMEWQLRILQGESLESILKDLPENISGHVIEARLTAQVLNAEGNMLPTTLENGAQVYPKVEHEIDAAFHSTQPKNASSFFDSCIGLLLVKGHDREDARQKLVKILTNTHLKGSNRDVLLALLNSEEFKSNTHTISTATELFKTKEFQDEVKKYAAENPHRYKDFVLTTLTELIHDGGFKPGEGIDPDRYPTTLDIKNYQAAMSFLDSLPSIDETAWSKYLLHKDYDHYISELKEQISTEGLGLVSVDGRDVFQSGWGSKSAALAPAYSANMAKLGASFVGQETGGAKWQVGLMDGFCPFNDLRESASVHHPLHALQRGMFGNGLDVKEPEHLEAYYKGVADNIKQGLADKLGVDVAALPKWIAEFYDFHFGDHESTDISTSIMLKNGIMVMPTRVFTTQFSDKHIENWVESKIDLFENVGAPLLKIRIKNPSQGKDFTVQNLIKQISLMKSIFIKQQCEVPIFYVHTHEINGGAVHELVKLKEWANQNDVHLVVDSSSTNQTHPWNMVLASNMNLSAEKLGQLQKFNQINSTMLKLVDRWNSTSFPIDPQTNWPGGTNASDASLALSSGISFAELKEGQQIAYNLIAMDVPVTPSSEFMNRVGHAIKTNPVTKNMTESEVNQYILDGGKLNIPANVLIALDRWETPASKTEFTKQLLENHQSELKIAYDDLKQAPTMSQIRAENSHLTESEIQLVAGFGKSALDFLAKADLSVMADAPEILFSDPKKIVRLPFKLKGHECVLARVDQSEEGSSYHWEIDGEKFERFIKNEHPTGLAATESNLKAKGPDQVGANMTGVLANVAVKVGDIIEPQQQLFQIEAMKMLNTITADDKLEGKKVVSVSVKPGTQVEEGDLIIKVETVELVK